MTKKWLLILGPETVLLLAAAGVFWFCARHDSGEGRDLLVLERLVMVLPLAVVPLAFATVLVPGAQSWWWLGRAIVVTLAGLMICAGKIIAGFGSGAKGQDAAFVLVVVFGIALVSVGTAATGALILAANHAGFAEWFRVRRLLGCVLTMLAVLPIGVVLATGTTVLVGVTAGIWSALSR